MEKTGALKEDRYFEKVRGSSEYMESLSETFCWRRLKMCYSIFFSFFSKMLSDERKTLQRAYEDKAGTIYFYYPS